MRAGSILLALSLAFLPAPAVADEAAGDSGVALDLLLAPVPPPSQAQPAGAPAESTAQAAPDPNASATATKPTFTVLEKDLINLIEQQIDTAGHPRGQLALSPGRPWRPLRLKGDPDSLRLELRETPEWRSSTRLVFRLYQDETLVGSWSMPFRCAIYQEVLFTDRPFARGESLDDGRTLVRRIDILDTVQTPVPADIDTSLYEMRNAVSAGRLLSWRDLRPIPLVRKGEQVEVHLVRGPLRIVMDALALQDGGKGEIVLLRNPDSNRRFSATVTDASTLHIRL